MKNQTLMLAALVGAAMFHSPSAQAAVEPGQTAPDFTLTDTEGNTHTLSDFRGNPVVLEWVNYDCPFVRKHYDVGNMQALQEIYTGEDVIWLSINSSAPGKQGNYDLDEWAERIDDQDVEATAVLLDPDGEVGRAYGAKTTPHMYIIDAEGTVVYQGAIDDNPSFDSSDIPESRNYVREALDSLLSGMPVAEASTTPYGCSVKY